MRRREAFSVDRPDLSAVQTSYVNPAFLLDKGRFVSEILLQITFDGTKEISCAFPLHKHSISIGREEGSDVVIPSAYVSDPHGRLYCQGGEWYYQDLHSTNGTRYNSELERMKEEEARRIYPDDVLTIDHPSSGMENAIRIRILDRKKSLLTYDLTRGEQYTIGRDPGCAICLEHVAVSKQHAVLRRNAAGGFDLIDKSTNGVTVNGEMVRHSVALRANDIIRILGFQLLYLSDHQSQCMEVLSDSKAGISLKVENLSKQVREKRSGTLPFQKITKTILDNVSLTIDAGDIVAIIGGSGAGKTTLMNAISGFDRNGSGKIRANGQDLYANFDAMKLLIGYVPQQDIVYDNLRLLHMLRFAAKLRMPSDTSAAERNGRVDEILRIVGLMDERGKYIRQLSGGQKKRASIAVELLADPKLFFLDEPMSGLDPGIEKELMTTLRNLSRLGKTILMVTHSTLQLEMCDKVIVMGKGGRLCYYGSPHDMLSFFGIAKIPDTFAGLSDEHSVKGYQSKYLATMGDPSGAAGRETAQNQTVAPRQPAQSAQKLNTGWRQLAILMHRYLLTIFGSPSQLRGIFLQALIFPFVLTFIGDANLYVTFGATQTVSFVNACLGMWMGLFLSIDEISKERNILRREHMAGVSFASYIFSKVLVLSLVIFMQACILQVFSHLFSLLLDKNLPTEQGILMWTLLENILSITFVGIASICMGLFLSAATKEPQRLAPYVLMPQIVLAGVLFNLGGGAFDVVSRFVVTYWGNRALCSTADINALPVALATDLMPAQLKVPEVEAYASSVGNLFTSWTGLLGLALLFLALCRIALRKLPNEER